MLTAKVVDSQLDVPKGLLDEGITVTILVPEGEDGFELSAEEVALIRESFAQIARGEWIDGEQLIDEIRRS